jgi:ORF6N domain
MSREIIPIQRIAQAIRFLRGEKVLLDSDLAQLYGVTTGNLNKAVARNADRFPTDFMFQLASKEVTNLKFQFGISSWGGRRNPPYAFTEQGVAMLSKNPRREIGFHVRERTARYRTRNGR